MFLYLRISQKCNFIEIVFFRHLLKLKMFSFSISMRRSLNKKNLKPLLFLPFIYFSSPTTEKFTYHHYRSFIKNYKILNLKYLRNCLYVPIFDHYYDILESSRIIGFLFSLLFILFSIE